MAKPKRPSLADMMQKEDEGTPAAMPEPRPNLVVVARATRQAEAPSAPVVLEKGQRLRIEKPHTSIFLDPAVRKALKLIAIEYNVKPHDLMLEGIDMVLTKYVGKTIKDYTT